MPDPCCPRIKFTCIVTYVAGDRPPMQLSKVYSDYGYDPAAGEVIDGGNVQVTGSGNRVVYKRPAADAEPTGRWGR